jgi:hypothetical protein
VGNPTITPGVTLKEPPCRCNLCRRDFQGGPIYDVQLRRRSGMWAYLCQQCTEVHGPGQLGVGLGQRYELQDDGRYMKTGG